MQNSSLSVGAGDLTGGEDSTSAISWASITAGTFVALALALIFLAFGAGMGIAAAPWMHDGMSEKHFSYIAAIWLIIIEWVSSGMGGYITGRLRTKWVGVHTHEVFFRDTAHGFLTWAVATVFGVVLLFIAAATFHEGHRDMMRGIGPETYIVDGLLRTDHAGEPLDPDTKSEASHILMKAVSRDNLSDEDKSRLSQIVAEHTGLSQAEAQTRVDDAINHELEKAQAARKTSATIAIFTLLAMLIGAFIASVSAALGGHERDEPYPHSL